MRLTTLFITMCLALSGAACDKDDDNGPGDGGGGWLVTDDGISVFVPTYGDEIGDYDITTRGDAVWVVAADGFALRSLDAGDSWQALDLDTTRDLHAVAAVDDALYIAGERLAMMSKDDGDSWTVIDDGDRVWTDIEADAGGAVLTARDGSTWRYAGASLVRADRP